MMAEFTQTMKDWRRMCVSFTTDDDETCCIGCPMLEYSFDHRGCDAIFSEFAENANWQDVENIVEAWAAEHPEPVYPTWAEWLTSIGVFPKGCEIFQTPLKQRIPADIAEKLGIAPKEGT